MYYAHSTAEPVHSNWQPLNSHLMAVAGAAQQFGARIGIGRAAWLAGLLHDLGKYTPQFQARLSGARERIDHSTAGAAIVMQLAQAAKADDRIIAELIAYCIAGHHAGLPDKHGDTFSTLSERLKAFSGTGLDPVWKSEIAPEIADLLPSFSNWEKEDRAKAAFQLGFLGRMIFSCLVDADFKDTEQFYARTEGRQIDRNWPELQPILHRLIGAFEAHMEQKRSSDTPVNVLRANVLDNVRSRACEKPGLFTLTVPTGGGKTLASLGFALDHAKAHGLGRIIYAVPFAGAWIETSMPSGLNGRSRSPLSQGRGSKRRGPSALVGGRDVAPLAGAWIETLSSPPPKSEPSSRPSRRGVDRNVRRWTPRSAARQSPLYQGCGIETSLDVDAMARGRLPRA